MNKQEFNAGKKAYQQPRMKVVEINEADIICTSPTASTFSVSGINFEDEEDWLLLNTD